ncbi:hypothetical protein ACF0H5_021193 [Mactra antiquata]
MYLGKFHNISIPKAADQSWQRYLKNSIDPLGFVVKDVDENIGKGVFTQNKIHNGSFILEYSGELINYGEAVKREKTYPESNLNLIDLKNTFMIEKSGCGKIYYEKEDGTSIWLTCNQVVVKKAQKRCQTQPLMNSLVKCSGPSNGEITMVANAVENLQELIGIYDSNSKRSNFVIR